MILQKLLFPNSAVCSREHMYYKGEAISVIMEQPHIRFSQGAKMDTATYFNSFSVGKWKKYTLLNNLKLRVSVKGEFLIHIHHARWINGAISDLCLLDKQICCQKQEDVIVPIPMEMADGTYYFRMSALSDDARFFGGAYETDVDVSTLADVKIGLGICGLDKKNSIAQNLELLRKEILENPENPMHGNLEIFVSDNSKSLPKDLETEQVHLFPNKNLGSAGGFARSMIEIHKVHRDRGITHIMMMDGDIRLECDSLLRTYAMLQLIKPKYRDAYIGGHLFHTDRPHIQSEAAAYWNQVSYHPHRQNYRMEEFDFVLKNEIEDTINFLGWWFCCMPIGVVSETNLPLPIFTKAVATDYGMRNSKTFITLNGICVWQRSSEHRDSVWTEHYYSFRNMCIINAMYRRNFNEKTLIDELKKRVKEFILTYRYREAELCMLGIQDYLKGIDLLLEQDGEKLNMALMLLDYKRQPMEQINNVFVHDVYESNLKPKKLGKKQRLIRKLTFNGHLLPARRTVLVPAHKPNIQLFFDAKKVINYEEDTGTAFITARDWKSIRFLLKMYRETVRLIRKRFKKVTKEYRARYSELTDIQFWNRYLFAFGEIPKIKTGIVTQRKTKDGRYHYYVSTVCAVIRLLQILLFWLPVKKNRVTFYAHERKGATCNPKYILKQLREEFGDKLELFWVTKYPETCQELVDMGIPVIPVHTKQHILVYLRTRFYISNDNFPIWAIRRPGQKWMNTWHAAMNYKHGGYDALTPRGPLGMHIFKMRNRQPDFYLSGSRFFTEDMAESFRLDKKVFLPTGLPRNDLMFTPQAVWKEKICDLYHIPANKKLVLYAPTFRKETKSNTYGINFAGVANALSKRFGGEWVVLFRNHSFIKDSTALQGAVDVSAYHDMQELLCAADLLISDYSSCLYDFALTGRPALVYATDLVQYINDDHSLSYPVHRWPYPIAQSSQELLDVIANFDCDAFDAAFRQHKVDIGAYDNGTASKQVAEIVKKYCL